MKVGIVALSPTPWDAPWRSRHHLLTRLPESFEVVWMEPPHDRTQLFSERAPTFRAPDPHRWPRFRIYTPQWWLPLLFRPRRAAIATARGRLREARRQLESRGCERFVFYLFRADPELVQIATGFDLVVYHILDEYSFSPADPPTPPDEVEMLRSVDQVVIHSLTMMEKKGSENPHTLFLPNGVDFPLHDREWPEPRELAGVPHPRVGYTGYLKNQLDWELISEMVSRHPGLSFIFVGPTQDDPGVREEIERLDKEPNTLFPGLMPVEDLPAWVCHFDVCIMPYQNDGYTRYIYPLKLHEYLAAGHPVVGTSLPNLTPFEGTITLADSVEEWSQALMNALDPAEHAQDRIDARKEVARAHDWDHLAARLGTTLLARIREKGGKTQPA